MNPIDREIISPSALKYIGNMEDFLVKHIGGNIQKPK